MNQTLIAKTNNKNIFLVNNNNVPFYLSIPTPGNVNIVINLVDDSNLINQNNNMKELTETITNIHNDFLDNNIAVVTPIIDPNILEQAKLNNDEQIFTNIDQKMSFLINIVYKILTKNNYQVNNAIILNNNKNYEAFNNWFVSRYNGRVKLEDYNKKEETKDPTIIMKTFNQEEIKPEVAPTPTIPNETQANNLANKVLEETGEFNTIEEEKQDVKIRKLEKEPGFVSYVLLGVIVAVISLVILYKLL